MFEDYYNNPELQGLLAAAAGAPIMDAPRQAAVMPMTQQAAPFDLSSLAGLDLSGLNFASNFGGGASGSTGYVADPNLQYFQAPVSNTGTNTGVDGSFYTVTPNQPVRLVDLKTNKVVFEGTGFDAARKATELAQGLTDTLGRKAQYNIQTADPSGAFKTVASEQLNKSTLGQVADLALPIAGTLLAGPLGLGALGLGGAGTAALGSAIGSGISSAAQGRSLQDSLVRAAIAGGGSYLGGQLFAPGAPAAMTGINSDLIPNALQGLNFGSLTSAAIPAGVGGAASDILVNAARNAASNVIGSAAGSAVGSSIPSLINSPSAMPEDIVVTAREKPALNLGPDFNIGGMLNTLPSLVDMPTSIPEDIVVTGREKPTLTPGGALGSVSSLINPQPSMPDEIVVTGSRPQEPNIGGVLGQVLGGTLGGTVNPLPPTFSTTTPSSTKDGVLGTGLTLPQLLSIGGVGADLLQSLLAGGGGGTGTGAPYVSPFGGGVGFAPGRDMRVNPNILDYERYGFGPEAMFFRPEYSGLVSGGTAPTQAPPAMTINPAYMPLI